MEKRRFVGVLVLAATFGGFAVAHADAPGPADAPTAEAPAPTTHVHARKKKKKARFPKVSEKCKSDADCAFTPYADGECCPTLTCQPRAVGKKSAAAIDEWAAACKKPEGGCPVLDCAPSPATRVPACVSGKCVGRAAPMPARE